MAMLNNHMVIGRAVFISQRNPFFRMLKSTRNRQNQKKVTISYAFSRYLPFHSPQVGRIRGSPTKSNYVSSPEGIFNFGTTIHSSNQIWEKSSHTFDFNGEIFYFRGIPMANPKSAMCSSFPVLFPLSPMTVGSSQVIKS